MKKILRNWIPLTIVAYLATSLTLAAKKPAQAALDPGGFSPQDAETIGVLAVADLRKDKSVEFKKLDEIGHRTVRNRLKKSTYELRFAQDDGGIDAITGDDLEYLDPDWVRGLEAAERYVLLLVLEDAARKKTLGSAFGTVCSGFLFDRQTGEAVWRSEATGTAGQGGLLGFTMNGAMRGGAFADCAGNLMLAFPYTKRSKKKRG